MRQTISGFSHDRVAFLRELRNSIDIDEPRRTIIPVNASLWLNQWVVIKQACGNNIILPNTIESKPSVIFISFSGYF